MSRQTYSLIGDRRFAVGEQSLAQAAPLHFSFETGLLALLCLLILSIFTEKIGRSLGINGAIFLFLLVYYSMFLVSASRAFLWRRFMPLH